VRFADHAATMRLVKVEAEAALATNDDSMPGECPVAVPGLADYRRALAARRKHFELESAAEQRLQDSVTAEQWAIFCDSSNAATDREIAGQDALGALLLAHFPALWDHCLQVYGLYRTEDRCQLFADPDFSKNSPRS
jgi:hypothetical protein